MSVRGTARVRWGSVAAALLGSAMILGAVRYHRPEPEEPGHAAGLEVGKDGEVRVQPGAPQWKVLKVAPAEKAGAGWTDPVPGRVQIDDRLASKVGTPLGGRVLAVLVDLGQRVSKGDPLFSVSSQDIAELRAEKEKADVDLDAARVSRDRVHDMVEGHALPAKEELYAEQQRKQAEVAARLAAEKLDALRIAADADGRGDTFVVVSPRDGIVVEKNVVTGQEIAPDAGLVAAVVADLSSVLVVADLFEDEATEVSAGAAAEVSMSRVAREPVAGTVERVSAIVDPARHAVPVRVRTQNPDGILRPNAFVTVRFATQADPKAVEVPSTAIVSDGTRQRVYVFGKDDRFVPRDVVVGATRGGSMILLDGLEAGEQVLVEGGILLDNQVRLGG
jgi:RND family efflux transporter MFP subunit